jgi:hypothetical protein
MNQSLMAVILAVLLMPAMWIGSTIVSEEGTAQYRGSALVIGYFLQVLFLSRNAPFPDEEYYWYIHAAGILCVDLFLVLLANLDEVYHPDSSCDSFYEGATFVMAFLATGGISLGYVLALT